MTGPTWFYCGLHKWFGDERCLYCRHAQAVSFEESLDALIAQYAGYRVPGRLASP